MDSPQTDIKNALYFEYVLIPGVNDKDKHAYELVEWMDNLRAKVNLIPYHPVDSYPLSAGIGDRVNRFYQILRSAQRMSYPEEPREEDTGSL